MTNAINKLVAAGRDPLEIVFAPLASDVAEWVEQDATRRLDAEIRRELMCWPPEKLQRLRLLAQAEAARETARAGRRPGVRA